MPRVSSIAARPSARLARLPATQPAPKTSRSIPLRVVADPPLAAGAIRAAVPEAQAPQLATNAERAPTGTEWLSEIKLDGYCLLVWLDHDQVRLVTRNGQDWTPRLPRLPRASRRSTSKRR